MFFLTEIHKGSSDNGEQERTKMSLDPRTNPAMTQTDQRSHRVVRKELWPKFSELTTMKKWFKYNHVIPHSESKSANLSWFNITICQNLFTETDGHRKVYKVFPLLPGISRRFLLLKLKKKIEMRNAQSLSKSNKI